MLAEIQPLISCYNSGDVVIETDTLLNLLIWSLTSEVSKKLLEGKSLESALVWMNRQVKGERKMP